MTDYSFHEGLFFSLKLFTTHPPLHGQMTLVSAHMNKHDVAKMFSIIRVSPGPSVFSFNGASSKHGCWSACVCRYTNSISPPSKAIQNWTGDLPGGFAVLFALILSIKQDFRACKSYEEKARLKPSHKKDQHS